MAFRAACVAAIPGIVDSHPHQKKPNGFWLYLTSRFLVWL
jgi:hypothetical protein